MQSEVEVKFTEAQRRVYEAVLEAQLACVEMVKPGVTQGDIHDKAAANRDWEHMFAMWRRQMPPA